MSIVFDSFVANDGTTTDLTLYNHEDDAPTGPAYAGYMDVMSGGGADAYGAAQAPSGTRRLRKRGEIIVDTRAALLARTDELRAMKGKLGRVYGVMPDDSRRWVAAKCDDVQTPADYTNTLMLDVTLLFTQLSDYWRGTHYGGNDGSALLYDTGLLYDAGWRYDELINDTDALAAGANSITLPNAGNAPVLSTRFRVKAGSAPITSVRFQHAPSGVDITWTGTLPAGQTLIIDYAKQKVLIYDGSTYSGAFSGFNRSSHTAFLGWLSIPAGGATYTVTVTGGGTGSTLVAVYSEAWV